MSLSCLLKPLLAVTLATLVAGSAAAQILTQVPTPGRIIEGVARTVTPLTENAGRTLERSARALASARLERLRDLVDAHPDRLEMTRDGPAVRGEIIAVDPSNQALAVVSRAGFIVLQEEEIEGLGLRSVTLAAPRGVSVDRALGRLRRMAPDVEFVANHLHVQSGRTLAVPLAGVALAAQAGRAGPTIGIIDGGVAAHPSLAGAIEQRGFVRGAPVASGHGTAIASLAAGRGLVRGAAPAARLLVADIYGADPAGGNALALARALGWMASARAPVVAISLVGPSNALVQRAVAAARARGIQVVAAVGNDGPAAPPSFPASYAGVIAVTGVDGRNRPLIEAGRSLHLDYAAPAADMVAAVQGGGVAPVRGTSYAVPLVAGRLARAIAAGRSPLVALDAEAIDLPPRGPDRRVGRGIVCADCRTPIANN